MSDDRLALRPRECARLLGISVRTLFEWRRKRGLPAIQMSHNLVMFDPVAVREWLRRQGEAQEAERGGTGR